MKNIGKKNDSDKLRYDLLPLDALEKIVEIITHGAKKYGDNNWKHLDRYFERYSAALLRHLTARSKGEKIDKDSELLHVAHIACNALFLVWYEINKSSEK